MLDGTALVDDADVTLVSVPLKGTEVGTLVAELAVFVAAEVEGGVTTEVSLLVGAALVALLTVFDAVLDGAVVG